MKIPMQFKARMPHIHSSFLEDQTEDNLLKDIEHMCLVQMNMGVDSLIEQRNKILLLRHIIYNALEHLKEQFKFFLLISDKRIDTFVIEVQMLLSSGEVRKFKLTR